MENQSTTNLPPDTGAKPKRRFNPWVLGCGTIFAILLVLGIIAFFVYRYHFHAKNFNPVELSQKEEVVLDEKLESVESSALPEGAPRPRDIAGTGTSAELPAPEKKQPTLDEYLEDDKRPLDEQRRIVLTEREINALLHKNTDLADRVKVALDANTIRVAIVVPVDEDMPLMGGKTIRGKVIVKAYMDENDRLALIVSDIYAWGVPIPSDWLAIKGKNLVSDPEHSNEFFEKFAAGIKDFRIEDGQIVIELNE